MEIIELQVENVKRINALTIKPTEAVVEITGKNEQGKSSTLDSILFALGGKGKIGDMPLRKGKDKGEVLIVLGDNGIPKYRVSRTFTKAGKSTLKVESADGATFKSPQSLIDSFKEDVAFNPEDFANADETTQRRMLFSVSEVNLDTEKLKSLSGVTATGDDPLAIIQNTYRVVYNNRTLAGHSLKNAKSLVESSPEVKKIAPVSSAELLKERKEIEERIWEVAEQKEHLVDLRNSEAEGKEEATALRQKIEALEKELGENEANQVPLAEKVKAQEKKIAAYPKYSLAEIDEKINNADAVNQQARDYETRQAKVAELAKQQKAWDAYTEKLMGIKDYEQEVIASAKFPIPKLGFDESGVTLEGIPLNQRGESKKILLGMTILSALNPKLRIILIRAGNDFDSETKTKIFAWARQNNFQVWIERVADKKEGVCFYIEDGAVSS